MTTIPDWLSAGFHYQEVKSWFRAPIKKKTFSKKQPKMKVSSCPNLNRKTTSYTNFLTLVQNPPDHHHDATLNNRPKIDHDDDDSKASVVSPFKEEEEEKKKKKRREREIEAGAMRDPKVEIDDEDLLSQVAAAEAQALSSKHRKLTTSTLPTAAAAGNNSNASAKIRHRCGICQMLGLCFKCGQPGHWARDCGESGSDDPSVQEKACPCGLGTCLVLTANTDKNRGRKFYKCPFREENGGCGFFEWCDQNEGTNDSGFRSQGHGSNPSVPDLSCPGGGGGSCFKCGKLGHWARDCGESGSIRCGSDDPSVQEKACPCGLGTCLVLTANTDKNHGRKFYKCPVREENGGCGFFEWCDQNEGTNNLGFRSQSHASNPSVPDLSCPCGAGSCLILTAKTGKNMGQAFYRCPANQGSSCGFFKWCHDQTTTNSSPASVNASRVQKTTEMSNKSYGTRGGSSCFKCGEDGHWAKDCPTSNLKSR